MLKYSKKKIDSICYTDTVFRNIFLLRRLNLNNLYIYIKNEYVENVIKYGMKLSEFADKFLKISGTEKAGITAY